MIERREFLSRCLKGLAGAAFVLNRNKKIFSQEKVNFTEIALERKTHPLYFDALSLNIASYTRKDIEKSGLSGFISDVSVAETVGDEFHRRMIPCLKSIARVHRFLKGNDQGLFLGTKGSQIKEAQKRGKTPVFLQFQSLRPITEDLDMMNVFYEFGLRILQFTHHCTNPFAGGSTEKDWTGLTELGFKAVQKMNELNIIPDLSHANDKVAKDVLKTSTKPVIISHTGCRAILRNSRCAPDSIIRGVADSGGVVGIFFVSFYLTNDSIPTVDHFIDHIQHVIKIAGINSVGMANDSHISVFSDDKDKAEAAKRMAWWWKEQVEKGVMGYQGEAPQHSDIPQLNNFKRYFTIQESLEKRGFKSSQIEKIIGGNWVRVLTDCLG